MTDNDGPATAVNGQVLGEHLPDVSMAGDCTVRVLVFAGAFPPAVFAGGPVRSLDALVSTAAPNTSVYVFANCRDEGQKVPMPVQRRVWLQHRQSNVMYLDTRSLRDLVLAVKEAKRLRPDLYYFNSFFSPMFTILPLLMTRLGILPSARTLLAPRGELCDGALGLKPRKKIAYLLLFRALFRQSSVTWHATSDIERADVLRVIGNQSPVFVHQCGTALPPSPMRPPAIGAPAALRLVFLSRIVRKKGLATVLAALRNVSRPVELDIYGPREDAKYLSECQGLIEQLPAHIVVRSRDFVPPEEVVRTFSRYDLFVFPTLGENFGHVIAESLAGSCPVMINDTTPWTSLLRGGGGVVVDPPNCKGWTAALEAYARLTPEQRASRRDAAGAAYLGWRSLPTAREHLFSLVARIASSAVRTGQTIRAARR